MSTHAMDEKVNANWENEAKKAEVNDSAPVSTLSTPALTGAVVDRISEKDFAEDDLYGQTAIDPVYRAKAHLLNNAIQQMGMGKYQVSTYHVLL